MLLRRAGNFAAGMVNEFHKDTMETFLRWFPRLVETEDREELRLSH